MGYAADVLGREREQIARKVDALADEIRSLRSRLRELDEAICHLSTNGGAPATNASLPARIRAGGGSRLVDRIEDMLPSSGDGTSPSELAVRLKEQGRDTSGETVASLLSRLRKEGKATKSGRAWFKASPFDAEPAELVEATSPSPESGEVEEGDDVAAPPPSMFHP